MLLVISSNTFFFLWEPEKKKQFQMLQELRKHVVKFEAFELFFFPGLPLEPFPWSYFI